MQVPNLRVEISGFPISDYRIHEGDLEFRLFTPSGESYQNNRSTWRRLTPNEIALHFRLNTIVGQWFQDKVSGWQQ
jgi:hypothetical protein